jgi:ABC-type antimicrobial peptide transport system permease subunit
MEVKTMDSIVSEALRRRRLMGALLCIFASFALMLSAIGLYGAISYSVAQRTHEIGLRMALGASRQRIIRLVLSEGLRLALAGIVLGALATFGAMRVLANAFFGIAGIHLVEVTAVVTILGTTAVLAAGVPALRASRLDPAVALREE